MQIVLLERVERLGQIGDVVRVRDGFARNFLLPQKKAVRATKSNIADIEGRRSQMEASNLKARKEAEAIGGKLDGVTVIVIRQASDSGQLYGSVNSRDIAEAVTEAGFTIDRRQVRLDRAVKALGLHPIRITLHPEVVVSVTANVAKSHEEAAIQTARGGAVSEAELESEEDAAEAALAAAEAALALAETTEDDSEQAAGETESEN
ncbi:MAG: 50S ribosomal protein L9 [Alphaproteobacteria bacterium]